MLTEKLLYPVFTLSLREGKNTRCGCSSADKGADFLCFFHLFGLIFIGSCLIFTACLWHCLVVDQMLIISVNYTACPFTAHQTYSTFIFSLLHQQRTNTGGFNESTYPLLNMHWKKRKRCHISACSTAEISHTSLQDRQASVFYTSPQQVQSIFLHKLLCQVVCTEFVIDKVTFFSQPSADHIYWYTARGEKVSSAFNTLPGMS